MNKYSEEQKNKIKNAVLESLKNGVSITKACEAANVAVSTFWIWRNEDEEFNNQVLEAKDSRVDIVEDELFENTQSIKDKDGKIVQRGNVLAQIFFLKNRSRGRWKDRQEIEHSGKVDLSNLSDEEIDDYLNRLSEKRRIDNKTREDQKGNQKQSD